MSVVINNNYQCFTLSDDLQVGDFFNYSLVDPDSSVQTDDNYWLVVGIVRDNKTEDKAIFSLQDFQVISWEKMFPDDKENYYVYKYDNTNINMNMNIPGTVLKDSKAIEVGNLVFINDEPCFIVQDTGVIDPIEEDVQTEDSTEGEVSDKADNKSSENDKKEDTTTTTTEKKDQPLTFYALYLNTNKVKIHKTDAIGSNNLQIFGFDNDVLVTRFT